MLQDNGSRLGNRHGAARDYAIAPVQFSVGHDFAGKVLRAGRQPGRRHSLRTGNSMQSSRIECFRDLGPNLRFSAHGHDNVVLAQSLAE
jgi:hypothetical protein